MCAVRSARAGDICVLLVPEQEEMAFTPAFQEKLAASISSGVLEFFGVARRTGEK